MRFGFKMMLGMMAVLMPLTACSQKKPQVAQPVINPYQMVTINTPGVVGAECAMETPTGVYRMTTPGSVRVPRSAGVATVFCKKGKYFVGHKSVKPRISTFEAAGKCTACNYPNTITVALSLHSDEMRQYY